LLGTIVNVVSIIVGTLFGIMIRRGIPDRMKDTLMQGMGLTTVVIGLSMALETENILIVLVSMVLGGVAGELIGIEDRLESVGRRLENMMGQNKGDFAKAFITASLVYVVGAMAIMGSLESGLTGAHSTLYVKSVLDGITSVVFASGMGIGVAFAAIPVLLYQGTITLVAASIKSMLTDAIINEMTATGGILIMGIGLSILNIKKINVGNMLPAIVVAIAITALVY
jgi:uncharacterized membrane protein YqgA involved in biofilm formation